MISAFDGIPLSPEKNEAIARELCDTYPFLSGGSLASSILGRDIPLLKLGEGKRILLYVGTHHGTEWMTGALLLHFLEELCIAREAGYAVLGVHIPFALKNRTLVFVPMLNPDGVAIAQGISKDGDLLAERRRRMNPSGDFSHWQANARGVDLNHNYDAGFLEYKRIEKELGIEGGAPTRYSGEFPESEPESAALAALVRTLMPAMVLSLHTQGEEIYYAAEAKLKGSEAIAHRFSRLSGYRVAMPEGAAAYGGLADYTAGTLKIPSFTLECGRGENPLPDEDAPLVYASIRRLLFESMIL